MRFRSLRTKIILAILVVGGLPLLLTYLLIFLKGTDELRHSLGQSFQGLAQETASKTDLLVEREFADLRELAGLENVRGAAGRAGAAYRGRSPAETRARLAAWARDPKTRGRVVFNSTSAFLRAHLKEEQDQGIMGHIAIFLTDDQGAVIASTGALPAFVYRDAEWWQAALAARGRPVISNVYYDDRIKSLAFRVAKAVRGPSRGRPLGVAVAEYDAKAFFKPAIHAIRFGRTGHAMLIDAEGIVIICPILPTGAHITDRSLITVATGAAPGWVLAANDAHGGQNSIVGFAPAAEVNKVAAASGAKRWHSFIRQDPKEMYTPIRALLFDGSLAGGLLLSILVFLGLPVATRLTRPIERLRRHAELLGQGHLDQPLAIGTGDEIEALADEFNRMAQRLKESYTTLEQKVADRTRELAVLNQVAMTVNESLDLQQVLDAAIAHVANALQSDIVAIRLWDPDRQRLLYRAAQGLPEAYLREREAVGLVGTISGTVFQSGRPIVIARAQESPEVNPSLKRLGVQGVAAVPIKAKDRTLGSLSAMYCSPHPLTDAGLNLLRAIGAQVGIAIENAELYTRTQAAVEQLKEADRLKTQFLSSVSHELRTPLTAIVGFTELLLDDLSETLSPEHLHQLEGLKASSDHLIQMINDLLDLAKLRAGRVEIRRRSCAVPAVIREAEQAVRPLIARKKQRLEYEVSDDLPVVQADPAKLRQILLNLLSNAVKFTPAGGLIRLTARPGSLDDRPAVEFAVSDTGIGIAPQEIAQLFDEFKQVLSPGTSDKPGTGLGLAISKRLVELHEGRIWAASTPAHGSTFTFVIPARRAP